ncbi:MAG: hypothetical protein ACRYGG_21910 [Janthinobacterium lividum]
MTKDSRKKLRRWSFAIEVEDKSFHIPVVTFGSSARAEQIAQHVATDYMAVETLKGKSFKVAKIPHETISYTTQQQLDGLELELKMMSKVIALIGADIAQPELIMNRIGESWNNYVGEKTVQAKKELMSQFYPDGAKVVEDSIEREKAALEDDYKMPLGKDAIQEVLNGPNEDSK